MSVVSDGRNDPAKTKIIIDRRWETVSWMKDYGVKWELPLRGTRHNTSTMMCCAIDAGARPCGHGWGAHASPQDIDAPLEGDIEKKLVIPRNSYTYGISVNTEGERLFEKGEEYLGRTYAKTGEKIGSQPGGKAYQIFEQKTIHLLSKRYSTGMPI